MIYKNSKTKYDFIYYNESVDFSESEIYSLKTAFPSINLNNISKIGPSTNKFLFEFNEKQRDSFPDICSDYGCNYVKEVHYVEININGTKSLVKVPDRLCLDQAFNCEVYKVLSLNYNCIGWALGIRDWINPSFENMNSVSKDNIHKFLNDLKTKYPEGHPKLVFPIIHNLEVKADLCSSWNLFSPNVIFDTAFYFKNDHLTHGARYIKGLNGRELNSWTSNLGEGPLISHKLEYLNDNSLNASYGVFECAGVIGDNYKDEL